MFACQRSWSGIVCAYDCVFTAFASCCKHCWGQKPCDLHLYETSWPDPASRRFHLQPQSHHPQEVTWSNKNFRELHSWQPLLEAASAPSNWWCQPGCLHNKLNSPPVQFVLEEQPWLSPPPPLPCPCPLTSQWSSLHNPFLSSTHGSSQTPPAQSLLRLHPHCHWPATGVQCTSHKSSLTQTDSMTQSDSLSLKCTNQTRFDLGSRWAVSVSL